MIDWFVNNWDQVLFAVTTVIAAASAIAALTPNTSDDKIVGVFKSIVEKLALNVGNAKTPPPTNTP